MEFLLGIAASALVVLILGYLLCAIGWWKMFQKAGQTSPMLRALIPIWNIYTLFKIAWNTGMFWVAFVLEISGSVISKIVENGGGSGMLGSIGTLIMVAGFVISVMNFYKVSRSFGHGVGFTILFIFFPWLTSMILGFGESRYYGPNAY